MNILATIEQRFPHPSPNPAFVNVALVLNEQGEIVDALECDTPRKTYIMARSIARRDGMPYIRFLGHTIVTR